MRRWRKMTWVLIAWCAVILVWAIAGGAGNDCASQTGDAFTSAQDAQDACAAGTSIGVALVLLIGFFGFAFLSIIWFFTRPRGRPCPRCGEHVKRGVMTCKDCGFDFATIGAATTSGA